MLDWNRPAGHGTHVFAPDALLTVPTAHSAPSVAPGGHQRPGGQGVHVDSLAARGLALSVPAGQSATLGEPSPQYPPGSQSMQAVAFVLD